jgi:uncharacterized membrane protein YeaQ/YmgE (transglycosylase-associated protein family)
MDDHFWPAMYPGLIVGILYGLSLKGWLNVLLGAAGSLVGAAVAYLVAPKLGFTDDIGSVVAMVALAFLGAFAATYVYRQFSGASPPKS